MGSQRHELGRLDIQETNKAPSQTGTPNQQQQANTQSCRVITKKEKEKTLLSYEACAFPTLGNVFHKRCRLDLDRQH